MRMQHDLITQTFLFRLAQALLPAATVLALFGRRVRVPVTTDRAAALRRSAMRRR